MPSCKNGHGSYSGKEPSPKGRGYCAKHEKVGTRKLGRDKKMWIVRSVKKTQTSKSHKRWFKVKKPAKKLPVAKKKSVKSKRAQVSSLKGGDDVSFTVGNYLDMMSKQTKRKLGQVKVARSDGAWLWTEDSIDKRLQELVDQYHLRLTTGGRIKNERGTFAWTPTTRIIRSIQLLNETLDPNFKPSKMRQRKDDYFAKKRMYELV
jgi:hypothetical protein